MATDAARRVCKHPKQHILCFSRDKSSRVAPRCVPVVPHGRERACRSSDCWNPIHLPIRAQDPPREWQDVHAYTGIIWNTVVALLCVMALRCALARQGEASNVTNTVITHFELRVRARLCMVLLPSPGQHEQLKRCHSVPRLILGGARCVEKRPFIVWAGAHSSAQCAAHVGNFRRLANFLAELPEI